MFNKSFVEDCKEGKAKITDLDKYIEYWHSNDIGISLREFLGLSTYEYDEWEKTHDNIFFLIKIAKFPKSEIREMNYIDTKNNELYHITRNEKNRRFTLFKNDNGKLIKIRTKAYPDFF